MAGWRGEHEELDGRLASRRLHASLATRDNQKGTRLTRYRSFSTMNRSRSFPTRASKRSDGSRVIARNEILMRLYFQIDSLLDSSHAFLADVQWDAMEEDGYSVSRPLRSNVNLAHLDFSNGRHKKGKSRHPARSRCDTFSRSRAITSRVKEERKEGKRRRKTRPFKIASRFLILIERIENQSVEIKRRSIARDDPRATFEKWIGEYALVIRARKPRFAMPESFTLWNESIIARSSLVGLFHFLLIFST